MKNIIFFLTTLFLSASCTKETPLFLSKDFTPEPYIEQSFEASCIPFIPIEIDTSVKWLDRPENPYQGRQEHGWARAEVKDYNYEWNASVRAFYFNDDIEIAIETFRSEAADYAFVERLYFKISLDANRCTSLINPASPYPNARASNAAYNIGDWDVNYWDYLPDERYSNQLEIIELDTINNQIKGRFDLQVVIEHPSGYAEIPDTIHFANGVFECDIL